MFPLFTQDVAGCLGPEHLTRRSLLRMGLVGAAWCAPVADLLARQAETAGDAKRPKSLIMLWLQGGPSQLETFDPHPGKRIGGDVKAIDTKVPGLQIASAMPHTAEIMDRLALLRCVTSKEGDHQRATSNMKSGYRPEPTLIHPTIGAVICHQLPSTGVEIPRHVSILPGPFPGRGGYVGNQFDPFKIHDPRGPLPDMRPYVSDERFERRIEDLHMLEDRFAQGRLAKLESDKTLHLGTVQDAVRMMTSEQIKAFDLSETPQGLLDQFGDTPFGRGCLVASRLIETGVRCVEVTLHGWDSHANNHAIQTGNAEILDAALAALVAHLEKKDLLSETIILCGGEFGRTPNINPAAGRDHWPHGFSMVMAGGGVRRGIVLGETDPEGEKLPEDHPHTYPVEDLHATIHHLLGIDYHRELMSPIGRPMAISDGTPIGALMVENG